jgi:Arc/MetJ-type ribon-helix-helix transcriptional regulator
MRQNTGAARGARIAVRLSQEDRVRIDEAVKARGYTNPSAFIRAAIQNELERSTRTDRKPKSLITSEGLKACPVTMSALCASQQALFARFAILLSKPFLLACRSHRSTRSPRPSPEPRTATTY